MIDKSLLEAMDAYRPGADARQDPQLAALHAHLDHDAAACSLLEKLHVLDTHITLAFQDVPVPQGLADRLLARIRQTEAAAAPAGLLAEAKAAAESVPENAVTPLPSPVVLGQDRLPANRRTFFKWAAALAASLLVIGLGYGLWPRRPPALSEHELINLTANWRQQIPNAIAWQKDEQPPQGFAAPAWLNRRINGGWATVGLAFGRPAVAYDVYGNESHAASSATLFVIQAAGQDLGTKPPRNPVNPSSSVSDAWIGCWQHDGLVYVLAVSGPRGDRDYHDLIRQAPVPGPLAQLGSHHDLSLVAQR